MKMILQLTNWLLFAKTESTSESVLNKVACKRVHFEMYPADRTKHILSTECSLLSLAPVLVIAQQMTVCKSLITPYLLTFCSPLSSALLRIIFTAINP